MSKNVFFIVLLASALSLAACDKCKEYTHIGFAKITTEYFGGFKPGAYWIYLNRDSTKKDSIWLDNYNNWTVKDRLETCIETDEISFDIHCEFLHYKTSPVSISTNTFGDAETNQFTTDFIAFNMRDDSMSFYNGFGKYPILFNYHLWYNVPNQIFPKVISVNHIVFAPDIGIIQYVSSFGNTLGDTFSLTKYYIP